MTELRLPPQGEFQIEALKGYRALAAAVLIDALKALSRWEELQMDKYLRLQADGRRDASGRLQAGEWERFGLTPKPSGDVLRMHMGKAGNPRKFLESDTIWHQLLDLDPEKVTKRIGTKQQVKGLYKEIRFLENQFLLRVGNPKGRPENLVPGAKYRN